MNVFKTIRPHCPGARRFKEQWGDSLIAVRYRRDESNKKVYTTIELIVDVREAPELGIDQKAELTKKKNTLVALKLGVGESSIRRKLIGCGALWSSDQRLWVTKYDIAVSLALASRIVPGAIEQCVDVDVSVLF